MNSSFIIFGALVGGVIIGYKFAPSLQTVPPYLWILRAKQYNAISPQPSLGSQISALGEGIGSAVSSVTDALASIENFFGWGDEN